MKIVITNAVTLNGGDAAILAGVMKTLRLRWPHATIDVFDSQADIAKEHYPKIRYHQLLHGTLPGGSKRKWHERRLLLAGSLMRRGRIVAAGAMCNGAELRYLRMLCDADLVVSTGGTYLVEVYSLQHRIFELALARACGAPVVFFTQSLGPFRKASSRRGLGPAFDASPLMLLRDPRSRAHLRELAVDDAKLAVVPDAGFALADRERLEAAPIRSLSRPPKVAISVRSWKHFRHVSSEAGMDRYREAVATLIAHVVEKHGGSVELVSTCQGVAEYWAQDADTAAEIFALLDASAAASTTVNASFHTPDELVERYAEHDIVVATRMHAGILALVGGTPVLPIAYEFKTEELFGALGMGDYVTHIDDADGDALCERFDRLLEELDRLRASLFEKVRKMHDDALDVAAMLPDPRLAEARRHLAPICRDVRQQKLTYLSDAKLVNIQHCLFNIERSRIAGDCIEAGVALGGSAIAICRLMGLRRFVGYDVFGMIPAPGERDDDKSHARYETIKSGTSRGIGGDDYYGYRDDLYSDVVAAFRRNGLKVDGDRITLERGLFEDTMHLEGRAIAFAHIDCDWFDPVALCLERIYAALVPGGYIVSDDYHDYGGCRDAVDAFLADKHDMRVVTRTGNLVMRRDR